MREIVIMGDILSSEKTGPGPTLICHQVNLLGVMGAGLEKQVKEKFPSVYDIYKLNCEEGTVRLGDVLTCSLKDTDFTIANCFFQTGVGYGKCNTDYEAMRTGLRQISLLYADYTIRIPYKMGCGLGGGDWNVVKQIIKEELIDKGIYVEIWELPQHV